MNVLYIYVISFILIWVGALLFRDKLKIEVEGIILMRKTQRLSDIIDRIAQCHRRLWIWLLNIGIVVSYFFMGLMLYSIIVSLKTLFVTPSASLIIPGVDMPGSPIFVPLSYGIIGLITVLFVHEFGHGILARAEGIKIKSVGLLLVAILPGAFVEPDEEEIKKSKTSTKLRIYAAGAVFNLLLATVALCICLVINTFIVPNTFEEGGIEIKSVISGGPSVGVLEKGMIIKEINGVMIKNSTDYININNNSKPGDKINIVTDKGTYDIVSEENPNNKSKGYIGIRTSKHFKIKDNVTNVFGSSIPWVWMYLLEIFNWIYLLNFLVGTFNLLPMKPLDGGLILEETLKYKMSENTAVKIMNSLSIFLVMILAVNIIWGTGRGLLMMLL